MDSEGKPPPKPPDNLFTPSNSLTRSPPSKAAQNPDQASAASVTKPSPENNNSPNLQKASNITSPISNTSSQSHPTISPGHTMVADPLVKSKNTQNLHFKTLNDVTNTDKRQMSKQPPQDLQIKTLNDVTNTSKRQTSKPPPIIINKKTPYKMVQDLIKVTKLNCSFKNLASGDYRLEVDNVPEYQMLLSAIKGKEIAHYTFQLNENKKTCFVIKGLHPEVDIPDLTEELKLAGHEVIRIHNALHKKTQTPSNTFFVDLVWRENNNDILAIKNLQHTKISIEIPKSRNTVLICWNCQGINHTGNYCGLPARCRFCSKNHRSGDCDLPSSSAPAAFVCSLCNKEGHQVGDKDHCDSYANILKKKEEKEAKRVLPVKAPQTHGKSTLNLPPINSTATKQNTTANRESKAPLVVKPAITDTTCTRKGSQKTPALDPTPCDTALTSLALQMTECMRMMTKLMDLMSALISSTNRLYTPTVSESTRNISVAPTLDVLSPTPVDDHEKMSSQTSPTLDLTEEPESQGVSTRARKKMLKPVSQSQLAST